MTENYLQVFKKYTILELDCISDYIVHSKKSISDAQRFFDNKLEIIEDGQKVIRITLERQEEYTKYNSIFPHFFRLSTFIGLFSYFENEVVKLSDSIQERKKYKIKPSDLIGENVIEKNYRYLKLVVGIELDNINVVWEKLRDLQKIRNRFVHNNSSIISDPSKRIEEQKIYPIVKKYPLITITEYGIMFIDDDKFLLDFIDIQKEYISKLVDKIDPVFRA